jgi:hypothetical protein
MHEVDDIVREKIMSTKCLGDTHNINKVLTETVYGSMEFFRVGLLCVLQAPFYIIYIVSALLR